jgi:glycosyltransferase involved in cell wall biosynthesis
MGALAKAGLEAWRFYLRRRDNFVAFARRVQCAGMSPDDYKPEFSIVSAVYNVERYLDRYFHSIVIQEQFCTRIQLIVVDDGSTDGSAATLEKWRQRYPRNITVLRQSNARQAAARNTGLRHATGKWVTFIDPDDFIERDYVSRVARFIRRHDRATSPMHFVSCRYVTYRESTKTFVEDHPLRGRFERDAVVPVADPGNYIQLHVNSVFFKRAIIEASALRFDERVRPTFEDGHFVSRFMMRCADGSIGFVRGARYYYRKRSDKSSTLDNSVHAIEQFDDVYRYGYCALLEEACDTLGAAPRWLQRTVLYDIVWQIRRYLDREEKLSFLDARQIETYRTRLRQVFRLIDSRTIARFELAGIRELHRIGLLGLFKSVHNKRSYIFINELDAEHGTFVLRWYAPTTMCVAIVCIDGEEVAPLEYKEQVHTLLHQPFFYEKRVRIARTAGVMTVEVNGDRFSISAFGGGATPSLDIAEMFATHSAPIPPVALSWRAAKVRRISQSAVVRERYENAWILMDRDVQADDSAEHLYRFLQRARDDINAYFVLRRDSKDWPRLEAEGFRLMPFGSAEHEYALLNARYLVSSHADEYVWRILPAHEYRDLLTYKFVFLQHGVISHDLATWLNTIPIDLMLSSSEPEHQSLAGRSNRYRLMPSQVALTGLPRHDALVTSRSRPERRILLMPTWRSSLVGSRIGKGTQRLLNEAFGETVFARAWKALLHAPRLKALADAYDYRITFFPHTNVAPYVPWFDVPSDIEVLTRADGASIQAAFKRSQLLVTDYSSVAFDMALIGRSVIYYQFDRDAIFTGIHSYRQGYFDYDRDGFGPVCLDLETLLDRLECMLANGGNVDAVYAARARRTFKWRDGNACRRTVQAIERLGTPVAAPISRQPSTVEAMAAEPGILLSHARTSRM